MTQDCSLPSAPFATPCSRRRCRSTCPGPRRRRTVAGVAAEAARRLRPARGWRRSTRPLLAVVGGSTGAGKSTLVNSLVGEPVTRRGVLRPTTRSPVLVHHPADAGWFAGTRVLPGLARTTGTASATPGRPRRSCVTTRRRRLASPRDPGLALLDAPDIDSVVERQPRARDPAAGRRRPVAVRDHRRPLRRRGAVGPPAGRPPERGTSVAIVLDRVPPEAMEDIRGHLASMLREQGLAGAPLFAVPETVLDATGSCRTADVAAPAVWLAALARDARARGRRRTAHPDRRPGLAVRPRTAELASRPVRRRTAAVDGAVRRGRRRVRRGDGGRRRGHDRRQPAAR